MIVGVSTTIIAVACSSGARPSGSPAGVDVAAGPATSSLAASEPATSDPAPGATTTNATATASGAGDPSADLVIDTAAAGRPIDPRIRGTNIPAWLGPETFTSAWFLEAIREAGVTTLRLPGGSWSNYYDWLGCELGDGDRCFWTWAARPSDFAQLLEDTGLEGIWTVNVNDTAQSAAAAVAFFNSDPSDAHEIGVDRNGVEWGTAGDWAQLRVDGGHPQPIDIELWEVGNEVFGGKPADGVAECASFGWEDVWTCDGTEYMTGNDDHDGYLAFRTAMRAVDPTIEVGAVGVGDPGSWSNWGNEVIDNADGALDFYVVHHYGFDQSPSAEHAFEVAQTTWPSMISSVRDVLPQDAMLAVTEYNLVSFDAADTEQAMTRAMNALFLAETLGQFAVGGVEIANQWNMANGIGANGTDYGLVDAADGSRFPQFHAFALWGRTGDELLDVVGDVPDVSAYPTRRADGSLAIVMINFDGEATMVTMQTTAGVTGRATIESRTGSDPESTDLVATGPAAVGLADDAWQIELPAWSISLVEVPADGAADG